MTGMLEILSLVFFAITGLSILSCAVLAGRADRQMKTAPVDSDFEEV